MIIDRIKTQNQSLVYNMSEHPCSVHSVPTSTVSGAADLHFRFSISGSPVYNNGVCRWVLVRTSLCVLGDHTYLMRTNCTVTPERTSENSLKQRTGTRLLLQTSLTTVPLPCYYRVICMRANKGWHSRAIEIRMNVCL